MKNKGRILIVSGLLLILAALFLAGYNLFDLNRAERTADLAASQLKQLAPHPLSPVESSEQYDEPEIPDYILNPDMDMPTESVDGVEYIGIMSIPSLELELPVISQWSYPSLKLAPCRYSGSAYTGSLIIAGHNYASHFGKLKTLAEGEEISFTDVSGNVFDYTVEVIEVLAPGAVEEMQSGDWALTLFTCTIGGQSRVTVRCSAN